MAKQSPSFMQPDPTSGNQVGGKAPTSSKVKPTDPKDTQNPNSHSTKSSAPGFADNKPGSTEPAK